MKFFIKIISVLLTLCVAVPFIGIGTEVCASEKSGVLSRLTINYYLFGSESTALRSPVVISGAVGDVYTIPEASRSVDGYTPIGDYEWAGKFTDSEKVLNLYLAPTAKAQLAEKINEKILPQYTLSGYQGYISKYVKAQLLYNDAAATAEEIAAAVDELDQVEKAMTLKESRVDIYYVDTEGNKILNQADSITGVIYSRYNVQTIVDSASAQLTNYAFSNYIGENVGELKAMIIRVYAVYKAVDKTTLNELVNSPAPDFQAGADTTAYTGAKAAGLTVYNSSTATQEQVDSAVAAIQAEIIKLLPGTGIVNSEAQLLAARFVASSATAGKLVYIKVTTSSDVDSVKVLLNGAEVSEVSNEYMYFSNNTKKIWTIGFYSDSTSAGSVEYTVQGRDIFGRTSEPSTLTQSITLVNA